MEQVISNFGDPSWWITGFFFSIFGAFVKAAAKGVPASLRKFQRGWLYKYKRRIKNTRFNEAMVYYQIAKANSYFLMFIVTCSAYFILFTAGPLLLMFKKHPYFAMLLATPIYIAEIAWLFQDSLARSLAKARGKIV